MRNRFDEARAVSVVGAATAATIVCSEWTETAAASGAGAVKACRAALTAAAAAVSWSAACTVIPPQRPARSAET